MVPVVLRPYSGEILYSWLARTAAVYGVDHSDLLGFPATPWDLLAALPRKLFADWLSSHVCQKPRWQT
jgi:hypothetical protein